MASHPDDDLSAEQTEGFKVGEKKTIDEYQKLAFKAIMYARNSPDEHLEQLIAIPNPHRTEYCRRYVKEANTRDPYSSNLYRDREDPTKLIATRQRRVSSNDYALVQVADRMHEEKLRVRRRGRLRRSLEPSLASQTNPPDPVFERHVRSLPYEFEGRRRPSRVRNSISKSVDLARGAIRKASF
ncbi:hypothetical protein ANO11243_030330 [Dothideomycetidae sp. 11243]|nr:hypothetical protein ANO11243_030330 [fungal sp. No.11243]